MTVKRPNECLLWAMSVIFKKLKIRILISSFTLFSKISIRVMNIFIKYKTKP